VHPARPESVSCLVRVVGTPRPSYWDDRWILMREPQWGILRGAPGSTGSSFHCRAAEIPAVREEKRSC